MNRLSDRKLAPLVAQVVPLHINTQSNQWQTWARKYDAPGNSIPIVYVVRADGKQLYGQTGAPEGQQLAALITQSLRSSGRVFSIAQGKTMTEAAEAAEKALSSDDLGGAVAALRPLKKAGDLTDLKSFAKPAMAIEALAKKLTEHGKEALSAASTKLDSSDEKERFTGALELAELELDLAGFDPLRGDLAELKRKVDRDDALELICSQAKAIARARAAQDARGGRDKAIEQLTQVVQRYPGTAAEAVAQAELKELGAEAPANENEMRTWTDVTGKFQVKAHLLQIKGESVLLKRENGQEVSVPISRLSEQDQKFLSSKR